MDYETYKKRAEARDKSKRNAITKPYRDRIAELEAKARTDADNIAELQQIVDSYTAFCRGISALVVLAQQDAEIKRLRGIIQDNWPDVLAASKERSSKDL